MLALETNQSGGKILPHSFLRGGVFPGEASRRRQRGMKIGTWNVGVFIGQGPLSSIKGIREV
jgi:hypothetical protein